MALPNAPIQTGLFNEDGGLTPPWVFWFQQVARVAGVPGPPGPSGAASPWVVDAYAASYTADMTLGWNHEVTATGNISVLFPTGLTSGQPFNIRVIQDATGGRQISLDAAFKSNRPDPGYQEALTSCVISGIAIDATTAIILTIQDNVPA